MDPDPNAKPKPKPKPVTPAPPKTDDTASSNNSYVGRLQQRNNYYAKKNKTPRANLNGVQSDSPVSKTPVNPASSPTKDPNNPSKSVSPDRRRPKDNNRKDPKGPRPPEESEDNKLNKPKENKTSPNKTAPNKNATNTQNKVKPTKNPPSDASPEKPEVQDPDKQPPESPTKKPQKEDKIDNRGYYKNFKADQILNQSFEPPDILQINHDTDPVDDPSASPDPKGYHSIYQKRKHFNEFKSLPKQTV
jgi:hypothetical protein